MKAPTGTIAMFYGLLLAIPPGWKSCDGTLGTPDLRNRFVRGAGLGVPPGGSGGSTVHNHAFTSDDHRHTNLTPGIAAAGATWDKTSNFQVLTGTTNNATVLPPYIALIYVQKI